MLRMSLFAKSAFSATTCLVLSYSYCCDAVCTSHNVNCRTQLPVVDNLCVGWEAHKGRQPQIYIGQAFSYAARTASADNKVDSNQYIIMC